MHRLPLKCSEIHKVIANGNGQVMYNYLQKCTSVNVLCSFHPPEFDTPRSVKEEVRFILKVLTGNVTVDGWCLC